MIQTLSVFMKPLLMPPGIIVLIALIGIIIWFFSKKLGNTLVILAFLSLWLLSTPFVAKFLMDPLQNKYPVLTANTLKHANKKGVIIVLGGGSERADEYDNKIRVSYPTSERVAYAAYLHRLTGFPIIVSGGKEEGAPYSEAENMARSLKDNYDIDAELLEDKSLTTADESILLAPVLKQKDYTDIYIVTNAWHMPRSVYIFNKYGIKVIPAPMGFTHFDPSIKALRSYLPNREALYASAVAMHEYGGLLWYSIYHSDVLRK